MKLRRCSCQKCYACKGIGDCPHCTQGVRCRHPGHPRGHTFGVFVWQNRPNETAYCKLKGRPDDFNIMVSGHRPQWMSREEQASTCQLLFTTLQQIHKRHPEAQLLSGMAIGTDLWAVEAAHRLGLPVQAAVPFKGHEARWTKEQQDEYNLLLCRCDQVHIIGYGTYSPLLYLQQNQWLVEHANLAVVVWGGAKSGGTWDAVQRIRKASIPCLRIWKEQISSLD